MPLMFASFWRNSDIGKGKPQGAGILYLSVFKSKKTKEAFVCTKNDPNMPRPRNLIIARE